MTRATKALITCTLLSLLALTIHTATYNANPWLWTAWALLAAATIGITIADRRR
ncbi:hypothetical protein ACWEPB_02640 [Kitasatospora cineracea]